MSIPFLRAFREKRQPAKALASGASATQAPPTLVLPVEAGSYVTIQSVYRVLSVEGDEATVSMRDPATGEDRNVIYPVRHLKVCLNLQATGDAKRIRLASDQPAARNEGDAS